MTAIMVSQNVFQKGPNARTISLNTHIHVLFANKRDEVQVSILAHQLFHSKTKKKKFLSMYDEHMKQRYARSAKLVFSSSYANGSFLYNLLFAF